MRVLVTGAGGQVGQELERAFAGHEVVACDRSRLDVADRDSVLAAITSAAPDAVVHAAAWTDVDGCETDPDRAFLVNALGTRHVAEAARIVGARVCYLSTDYVFSGESDRPYHEWDATDPRSVYGRSKLAGEHELDPGATVVRTSWVFGEHGHNIVKTILRLAGTHDTLRFVEDQHGHPTDAGDLAAMVVRLVVGRRPGVFHVTNQGAVSWHEFAQAVMEAAGHDPARVLPIASADLDPPRPAHRPANSVLDNAALRLSGVELLPDFGEPLARVVKALQG